MLNMHKKILVTALGLATFASASQAALQAVDPGPYTAATGYFPLYYTDTGNLTLDLCLSKAVSPDPAAGGGLLCNLLPNPGVFDTGLPVVFPVNFPDEAFWFTADANVVGQGINLLYIAHLEAAFAAGLPVPGDQISFARIRVRADFDVTVPTPGVYRITHPYGVKEFSVAAPGRRVINDTVDIGIGAPGDFSGALGGQIGPFLRRAAAPGGTPSPFIAAVNPDTGQTEQFIGDPNVLQFATGSPFGADRNLVRIERIANLGGNPTGDINVSTDQFFLSGRVWNGQRPTPVAVERASYSRTVDPVSLAVTTQIDGFASSTPTAGVCFRRTLALLPGENPCLITMTGDGAGKFFGRDANAASLPPYLVMTATDPIATPPTTPTRIAQALTDMLKVTKAQYARDTGTLLIDAASSDQTTPPKKITAVGLGVLSPIPGTANQRLQVELGASGDPNRKEPPAFVTLVSSGGGRDTEPVTVLATAAAANRNPVANADSETTPEDTAVVISVLANDTDPDGDTLNVTGVSGVTNGTATPNGSTVTFTPAPNFNGTAGFNYSISDGNGGTAGASVTVTVTPVNDPPVITSTPVTGATVGQSYSYDVNATDPENNTLTYTLTQSPAGMTINQANGLISWTPTAAQAGTNAVTVTVSDNGTTNGVSDPKSVTQSFTITVGAGVDLDINRATFPGSGRVGRALSPLSLRVNNGGTVNGTRTATLTGTQNGAQVYNRSISVSDAVGGGTTTFDFPTYTPTALGTINWRVEIFDDNPDSDVATGTTAVAR